MSDTGPGCLVYYCLVTGSIDDPSLLHHRSRGHDVIVSMTRLSIRNRASVNGRIILFIY